MLRIEEGMNKSLKLSIDVIVVAAALACSAAAAHVPYFEDADLTDEQPFLITDVEQSKAIYAWLDDEDDVDPYVLQVTEPSLLYVKTIIPLCKELADFRPSFAITGPGLSGEAPADLPFSVPDDLGVNALVDDSPGGFDRPSMYEFFSDQFYFEGPIFRLDVEQAGEYKVYVWDERGHTGDYVAIIGRKERFSLQDMKQSAVNTMAIRGMKYLHGPCSKM